MIISSRGRYAISMMCDLAQNQGDGCCALNDIAQRQCISKKYLEQIIPCLNKAGFLVTTRGYQGGYRLARAPQDYTLREILRCTEGDLTPVGCIREDSSCPYYTSCPTAPIWEGLGKVIDDYLDGFTLQDIVDRETCGTIPKQCSDI